MRTSLDNPEQFDSDSPLPDLRNDPDYCIWSATLYAETCVEELIPLKDALDALRQQGETGDVLEAFTVAFNRALLNKMARDAGIDIDRAVPETFCPECDGDCKHTRRVQRAGLPIGFPPVAPPTDYSEEDVCPF